MYLEYFVTLLLTWTFENGSYFLTLALNALTFKVYQSPLVITNMSESTGTQGTSFLSSGSVATGRVHLLDILVFLLAISVPSIFRLVFGSLGCLCCELDSTLIGYQ